LIASKQVPYNDVHLDDTMEASDLPIRHEEELCRFMGDEYASKIMSATYGRPLSIQQISEICEIPIAVAYRRVGKMASVGLLVCVRVVEVFRGKKEKYYACAVETLQYAFEKGSFSCKMSPMTHLTELQEIEVAADVHRSEK
jgi:hypothetical protein